jgi:lipopolysaccharide/colanic/teichoic acid biosynthesis glycosyltransferase
VNIMARRYEQEAVVKVSDFDSNLRMPVNGRKLVFYTMLKRAIDITGALFGLIFFAPLFLVIAILIKLEDPRGSVLFYQIRIGKNENPFRMYKFRSMVSNAEEMLRELLNKNEIHGAMFKMKDDPRITKIGKFIRKTSIDELPQLINVLKGDMSLVGPRPSVRGKWRSIRITISGA